MTGYVRRSELDIIIQNVVDAALSQYVLPASHTSYEHLYTEDISYFNPDTNDDV